MTATVDWSHDAYVTIIVPGLLTKSALVRIMSEILEHPDYPRKHTLWDLRRGTLGLSIGDLKDILGAFKLYQPDRENFADRAALLVSGKTNEAMARVFVLMTRLLPVKYRVFSDWEAAEAFLLSPKA